MPKLIALFVVLTCASAPVLAQAPDSVFLEDMTWTELRDAVKAGKTTIIIPVGGVEQSGPDMALGKHDARARFLSDKIARRLGNALVAPVIAYVPEGGVNPPTSHMRFPGTLTVPPDVFRKTVESAAQSLKLHGFKDVVLIGEHGSYQSDLRSVADQLNRSWAGSQVRARLSADITGVPRRAFIPSCGAGGYSAEEIGTHAGLADTSLMLAIDPRLVRIDGLHTGAHLDTADGVYGNPRRSSAELGQLAVDEIVSKTVEAIKTGVGTQ